jgi:hypothetical protein
MQAPLVSCTTLSPVKREILAQRKSVTTAMESLPYLLIWKCSLFELVGPLWRMYRTLFWSLRRFGSVLSGLGCGPVSRGDPLLYAEKSPILNGDQDQESYV